MSFAEDSANGENDRLFAGITTAGIAATGFPVNSEFVNVDGRGDKIFRAIVFASDQG